jgi:hypothetical protein
MKTFPWTAILLSEIALPLHAGCPPKIADKLCPEYSLAGDTQYLKVRIVLDAASEVMVPKGQTRPLRVWTEDMLSKYDLRTYADKDSSYKPRYGDADNNPAIDEVMYHNASIQKANLESLISEAYVFKIEQGCAAPLSTTLCTEMNAKADTTLILCLLILKDAVYADTAALKTYYSKYDFRLSTDRNLKLDPSEMVKHPYNGVYATVAVLKSVSLDTEVRFAEKWSIPVPSLIRVKGKPETARKNLSVLFKDRMLNGKSVPVKRK